MLANNLCTLAKKSGCSWKFFGLGIRVRGLGFRAQVGLGVTDSGFENLGLRLKYLGSRT